MGDPPEDSVETFGGPSHALEYACVEETGWQAGAHRAPQTVGNYEIKRLIWHSKLAAVYAAKDLMNRRSVALREIIDSSQGTVGWLKAQAEIWSGLTHPWFPKLYEYLPVNGRFYFASQYVDGEPLDAIIRRKERAGGRVLGAVALGWAMQLCEAVALLHQNGLFLCDIWPKEISLTPDGQIVLLGLCTPRRRVRAGTGGTTHDFATGYAAPELYQAKGVEEELSLAVGADIFAIGATLFRALTLKTPPDARLVMPDGLPPDPRTWNQDLSAGLASAIERAMSPNRAKRIQSISELRDELLQRGSQAPSRTISHVPIVPGTAGKPPRRPWSILRRPPSCGRLDLTPPPQGGAVKGIAVDEAGLLYAAWSSGVVQFYEENNPVPSYTVLLPAQCVEILDLEATGRGDSSVCCVLVRAAWLGQTGPVLYDVRRDQKPMRFRGKLPPGSRSVACHAGARFILSKGKPSTNRQHVACLSTGGGIDLPEGVTPHDLLASDRALYLVGKAAGQKHRIWRTSRKSTFWKAGYEAHEPLVASLDPEGERIFVVSDACVVILDFLQKTETRIESPDIKDGHSVSTGGNRLYVLDAEAGCAYWYAHEWLAPRRTPERPLQELSGEGIAATQDQEATE